MHRLDKFAKASVGATMSHWAWYAWYSNNSPYSRWRGLVRLCTLSGKRQSSQARQCSCTYIPGAGQRGR